MALAQIRRSDVSGKEIPAGTGARVRVMFFSDDKPDRRADLTDAEVEKLLSFTREVQERPNARGTRKVRL